MNHPQGVDAKKASEVDLMHSEVSGELNKTHELGIALEKKLEVVMSQNPEACKKGEPAPSISGGSSPYVAHLRGVVDQIVAVNRRLISILERLEV